MKVAVAAPAQWLDPIVSELERRGATIDQVSRGLTCVIVATARMADMLGFDADLQSKTQGSAAAAMALHTYDEAPGDAGPDDSHPMAAALRA